MIAVDANVLMRILADDPGQPAQVEAARRLAGEAKTVFVPVVALVETVWVLETGYGLAKEAVVVTVHTPRHSGRDAGIQCHGWQTRR